MKLAVVGEYEEIVEAIIEHGKKLGFEMQSADDIHGADAILCVLRQNNHSTESKANHLFEAVTEHASKYKVKRLVIFSPYAIEQPIFDGLRALELDWTIITHDIQHGAVDAVQVAKHLISETTSALNIGRVSAFPAQQSA